MLKTIQKINRFLISYMSFFVIIFTIFFSKINLVYGANNNWVEVSKTPAGIQYFDRESLKNEGKGIIEIKAKYLKINTNNSNKSEENIYIMKINCLTSQFKDISINGKKISSAKWEAPNEDKLLNDMIFYSCETV
tara:strand:- start:966 stop:1370 length:405 start_codon:yes stop_codon:yes gene_type:complete